MKICTTCGREWPDDTKFCPNDGSSLRAAGGTQQLVGSVIAERYHILKKLGEGGMGAVYLGEHVKMGRKSAIKVMAQSMAHDPDAIARFNREAANAARINHPNVCQIYDFGETPDGVIYLAMEFIEGEALTDLIEREGALDAPRAAKIIQQAADALQAAHDMGIVHRDLKPDNIMVTRGRGGEDVVKVVDFGIAKAMGGAEGQKVTKTGLVVGTPEYMSPEQLSGDRVDGRSDIYSLALVLYRMLTGMLPFEADSAQEVMIKRLTDEPTPLNEAIPGTTFPPRLQHVLTGALRRMPTARCDNAARFGKDVMDAVQGMPETAPAGNEDATVLMDAAQATAALQIAATRVAGQSPKQPAPPARTRTPDTAQPRPSPALRPRTKAPVGVIVAAVVGLGAVGIGAVVMLGGRNAEGGAAPDSAQSGSLPVTNGTAQPAGGNDRPDSSPVPGGRRDTGPAALPESTPQREVAMIDSMAVERRMNDLTDPLLEEQSLSVAALTELRQIHDNRNMIGTLRGKAARYIMQSYQLDGRTADACAWGERALHFPMDNLARQSLLGLRATLGCPS